MKKLLLFLWGIVFVACGERTVTPENPALEPFRLERLSDIVAGTRYLKPIFPASSIQQDSAIWTIIWNPVFQKMDTLWYDWFYSILDDNQDVWAITYESGGAFKNANRAWGTETSRKLAMYGYKTFSNEYRQVDDFNQCTVGPLLAGADYRAFISFLKSQASFHNVDTTKIVAHGQSAGAYAAWMTYDSNLDTLSNVVSGFSGDAALRIAQSGALICALSGFEDYTYVLQGATGATLTTHCRQDEIVPFILAQQTVASALVNNVPVDTLFFNVQPGYCHVHEHHPRYVPFITEWIYSQLY